MNDEIKEIKEILDRIETASEIFDCLLKPEECTELLDYITNLQQAVKDTKDTADDMLYELKQENERLKENNSNMQEEMARTWGKCDDYKSRCEKAIEYIEEILYPIGSCVNGSDLPYESIESLLNILQNGSDSQ